MLENNSQNLSIYKDWEVFCDPQKTTPHQIFKPLGRRGAGNLGIDTKVLDIYDTILQYHFLISVINAKYPRKSRKTNQFTATIHK